MAAPNDTGLPATSIFEPATALELTEQMRTLTRVMVDLEQRIFKLETALLLRRSERLPWKAGPTGPRPATCETGTFGTPAGQSAFRPCVQPRGWNVPQELKHLL